MLIIKSHLISIKKIFVIKKTFSSMQIEEKVKRNLKKRSIDGVAIECAGRARSLAPEVALGAAAGLIEAGRSTS